MGGRVPPAGKRAHGRDRLTSPNAGPGRKCVRAPPYSKPRSALAHLLLHDKRLKACSRQVHVCTFARLFGRTAPVHYLCHLCTYATREVRLTH